MSIRCLVWVLDESRAEGTDRLVLLAIAEEANEDGLNAWPGMARIARRARIHSSTATRAVARLTEAGELLVTRPTQQGRGHHNRYALVMGRPPAEVASLAGWTLDPHKKGGATAPLPTIEKGGTAPPFTAEKGGATAPLPGEEGWRQSSERVAQGTEKGWRPCITTQVTTRRDTPSRARVREARPTQPPEPQPSQVYAQAVDDDRARAACDLIGQRRHDAARAAGITITNPDGHLAACQARAHDEHHAHAFELARDNELDPTALADRIEPPPPEPGRISNTNEATRRARQQQYATETIATADQVANHTARIRDELGGAIASGSGPA